jgi:tetratricopeptide (TPR) repeat protein
VGNLSSAEAYLREAFQIANQLNAADPTNFEDVGTMQDSGSRLSELRARAGDFVGAIAELKRIAELYEKESTAFPAHIRFRSNLAETYASLGQACVRYASAHGETAARQLQYWHQAREWYQRSLHVWEDLRNKRMLTESDIDKPAELTREIASCDTVLARNFALITPSAS